MTKESSYDILLNKRWRAISYNWDVLSTYGQNSNLYCLTDFQAAWLLSNTQYMRWSSRWSNCPCTDDDLDALAAEMEYNLMNCLDFSPYQLEYLYDTAQNAALDVLQSLWDADPTPSAVNANCPDDFYSGDASNDRLNALCTTCKIYIYSYAQNWVSRATLVLGLTAILGLASILTVVGGIVATVVIGGLAYFTSIALDAMQDEEALNNVVCCMRDNLDGTAITQANFETCLDSCGFMVGSNEQIIVDLISSDLDVFKNWLTFINQLGNSFVLAQAGVYDCPCDVFIVDRLFGNGNLDMSSVAFAGVGPATYLPAFDVYRATYNVGGTACFWDVRYTFPVTTLCTTVLFRHALHRTAGVSTNSIFLELDGVQVDTVNISVTPDPQIVELTWSGSLMVDEIRVYGGIETTSTTIGGCDVNKLEVT